MSIQFSADAIFEIGIRIEKNGRAFYLEAAKSASDETVKSLFTELAEWENKHVELFKQLKSELPENMKEDNLFDPDNEFRAYLEAAADSHVFVSSMNVDALAAQCSSPSEALEAALTFEKDSVVYYTAVKKVVSGLPGREKIDRLIDEELKHIAILNSKQQQI